MIEPNSEPKLLAGIGCENRSGCYDQTMDTQQIVALLIAERDRLNTAIEALQGPTKRRGRPSKHPFAATPAPVEKKRKVRTTAQRKAHAQRMRDYWAKRKKAEKTTK